MHVQEMANAVSGAVEVAQPLFPEILACQGVELHSACALGEDGCSERNVPFHYKGEIAAFLRCGCAHADGAGDVGGAGEVLCAGVDEEQTVVFHCR